MKYNMNLQEQVYRIQSMMGLNEVRVPRKERVELYKDDNIIVVVPLTHRALQKYASFCQWCINNDDYEWEEYHKGHSIVIQRNQIKLNKGITGMDTAGEILLLSRVDDGSMSMNEVENILGYKFESEKKAMKYLKSLTSNINNFAINIVYYHPENGVYDMEDNHLEAFNHDINSIPNVTPKVVKIMNDYYLK
jgi:hypothetical protein